VTAEAPMVNTTSGSLGGLVSEQKVADLPLNGRNYIDLTLLQPGVTQHKNVGGLPIGSGTWYSSNGAPIRSNNYMLDGAILLTSQAANSAGSTGNTLGIDGIREMRVITNFFSAEYGMTMGSQVIMVSKGGSNSFHGDVFEYLRNSALDARNFFDRKSTATGPDFRLPPYKRNQFGASAGGPLKKDKTFVYGVYEGLRQRLGLTNVNDVIGAGCHGAAGATITNTVCPQLGTVASVRVSPVTAPFLAQFPLPNLGLTQFTFPATQAVRDDYGQIRADHVISSKDSLFGRFTMDDTDLTAPPPAQEYPQSNYFVHSRNQFDTLSENHLFTSALLSTARFSYSRTTPISDSHTTVAGPQYAFMPVASQEMGIMNIGGVKSFGPLSGPNYRAQNIFTWSDDLFYTRGKHSLKFGTLINRYQQFNSNASNARGTVTFASVATFLQANPTQFLGNTTGSLQDRTYRFSTLGFYGQDDIRLTSRLTLNVGLRYEFATQLHEIRGIQIAVRDIQHDPNVTVGLPFLNPSLKNFSPRVGFAWDVTGDGKTAVRGGFGEYYDLVWWGSGIAINISNTPPFSTTITAQSPAAGTFTIPFTFPAAAVATNTASAFDYHIQQPHLLSYDLAVERQLPGGMALTLAYTGSRGMNLLTIRDGNPTVPQGLPLNGACAPPAAGQSVNIFQGPICWVGGDPNTNRNFGQIALISMQGNSFYNSLQFALAKQLSHGLQFQSAYTWSKAIDEGQGTGGDNSGSTAGGVWGTRRSIDRAVADFDVTQNLRFNAIYRLPDLASGNGFVKALVNGWQATGILSLQSGYPFTPSLQTNRSRSRINSGAANIDRPDLVVGRNGANMISGTTAGCLGVAAGQELGTPTLYFDPCAFTVPAAGFLGTAGRGILRGPGLENLDFSLVKDTALKYLGESGRLQFRVEFFNILNRANFLIPGRTVFAGNPTSLLATTQAPLSNTGVITSTGSSTSRQIQLALKVIF
jgi:hypothetical protein